MTTTEATAASTLLAWLLEGGVADEDAEQAAAYLAGRAHARLGAGFSADEVRRAWRERRPLVITDHAAAVPRPIADAGGRSDVTGPDQKEEP